MEFNMMNRMYIALGDTGTKMDIQFSNGNLILNIRWELYLLSDEDPKNNLYLIWDQIISKRMVIWGHYSDWIYLCSLSENMIAIQSEKKYSNCQYWIGSWSEIRLRSYLLVVPECIRNVNAYRKYDFFMQRWLLQSWTPTKTSPVIN